jgi:hypothetical protein
MLKSTKGSGSPQRPHDDGSNVNHESISKRGDSKHVKSHGVITLTREQTCLLATAWLQCLRSDYFYAFLYRMFTNHENFKNHENN